jgi:hypothetical protein
MAASRVLKKETKKADLTVCFEAALLVDSTVLLKADY